jgi:hypothetical protein
MVGEGVILGLGVRLGFGDGALVSEGDGITGGDGAIVSEGSVVRIGFTRVGLEVISDKELVAFAVGVIVAICLLLHAANMRHVRLKNQQTRVLCGHSDINYLFSRW